MKKAVKWIIGILLVLVLGAYGYYESQKPIEAELMKVEEREVTRSFKEEGTVQAKQQRDVYSLFSEKIISLPVEEGQTIEEGQVIASLDGELLRKQIQVMEAQRRNAEQTKQKVLVDLENQIEQQNAMINETQRQLDTAEKDLERIRNLYQQNSASSTEVESMENRVEQLKNTIAQQQLSLDQLQKQYDDPGSETIKLYNSNIQTIDAQLDQLESQLDKSIITAPIKGTIVNLNYKEGSVVNPQIPVCTVYNPNEYRIEVFVLTDDAADLTKGMKVNLIQKLSEGDFDFSGTIDYIAPAAIGTISTLGLKEQRVKVSVSMDNPSEASLFPGYSVDVEFTTFKQSGLMAIPKTSVFKYEGKDAVWVVQDGTAVQRLIKKGISTDVDVVIEEGLSAGDIIIKNPNIEGLTEGKAVVEKAEQK